MTEIDCFVGASTGTFKVVDLKNSKFRNANSFEGKTPKEHQIIGMCFADKDQNEVVVAQKNGQINVYSTIHDTYTPLFEANYEGRADLLALQVGKKGTILTADSAGHIRQWTPETGECSSTQIEVGQSLECVQIDPLNVEVAATGGRENPLKLWDLEKGVTMFTAKNVKDSSISLRVPIWVKDARFVNDSKQICTTTGHHKIRLYDPKAQRRPVMEVKWGTEPIIAMSTCHRPQHIMAGNTHGEMSLFDLRNKIRPIQKYKGFAGSIRSIHAHPTEPFVAACGVDRFVMVHNVDTRKTVNKIYCKTRLTSLLLRTENSLTSKKVKEEDMSDDDEFEPEEVTQFFED
ncbi:WD repeat-containing protein 74 [Aphelenchoides bicaudatus]|nr:WD repeat-containing protein 74 [Aphelenchoides bicaudatus]